MLNLISPEVAADSENCATDAANVPRPKRTWDLVVAIDVEE